MVALKKRLNGVLMRPFGFYERASDGDIIRKRIPIADFNLNAPLDVRLAPSAPAGYVGFGATRCAVIDRGSDGEGDPEPGDWFTRPAQNEIWVIKPGGTSTADSLVIDTTAYTVTQDFTVLYSGTAENAAASTLRDNQRNWTTDELIGHVVELLRGPGAGQERYIGSNIAKRLNTTRGWDEMPAAGTTYRVITEPQLSVVEDITDNDGTWRVGAGVIEAV